MTLTKAHLVDMAELLSYFNMHDMLKICNDYCTLVEKNIDRFELNIAGMLNLGSAKGSDCHPTASAGIDGGGFLGW